MAGPIFGSHHMPCPDCGASVEQAKADEHVCDDERILDYKMFQHRDEVARFDEELCSYLLSNEGEFEMFYAEWQRRNAA